MRPSFYFLFVASTISAAPPTLTSLYPAGGQQGKSVDITASGTFDPWPVQASASDKGIVVKPGKTPGKLSVTIAADVSPGVHWLRLVNADGASEQRPFVVGSLPEVMEADPNDDPKKPQVLAVSEVVVNGKLNPVNDVDHYALELKKGQTLVASLMANEVLRSPMDGFIQILSPEGFVLAENSDCHELDPQVAFTIPADGRYLVRVFAFPAKADSSIRFYGSELSVYRLTLTTGGFADHVFPLAVTMKKSVSVELFGWNIPDSAKRISLNPEAAVSGLVVRHPGVVNSPTLRVEPHPCMVETEPNNRARPQSVESPITISGRINPPRDIDVFSIALKKGDKRLIKVEANALGSPLDPVLEVFDSMGKSFKEIDDIAKTPDPELLYTAPVDGVYRIEIRDRFQHGGQLFYYRLRITQPEADFTLNVTPDQFSITVGETVEIPVTVNRLNAFASVIELRALDLPKGVTCEPVMVDKAAKAAKLKLVAKTDAVSGSFRIEGSAGYLREGRVNLPLLEASVDTFWLTVHPAKK